MSEKCGFIEGIVLFCLFFLVMKWLLLLFSLGKRKKTTVSSVCYACLFRFLVRILIWF